MCSYDLNPESLNKEIAIHLVSEPYRNGIVNGFIETLGAYIKPTRTASKKRKSAEFDKSPSDGDSGEEFLDDIFLDEPSFIEDGEKVEFDTEYCDSRFLRQICRYKKEIRFGCRDQVTGNLLKTIADIDASSMAPFLYKKLQGVICTNFEKYALKMLSGGISENDMVYRRVQTVKKTYRLTDDETEMLVYMWLHNRGRDADGFGQGVFWPQAPPFRVGELLAGHAARTFDLDRHGPGLCL